jgi:predicted nucleic acid-binding protein
VIEDLVVDTSVLIAVLVGAPERAALIERTAGFGLVAPSSVHWEVGNAFSAMLRRKRISLKNATAALESYDAIPIRFVDVDLTEALEISSETGMYAYDAYLIATAMAERARLITLDRGLSAAASQMGVSLVEVQE